MEPDRPLRTVNRACFHDLLGSAATALAVGRMPRPGAAAPPIK
jgi:hypothetical protein